MKGEMMLKNFKDKNTWKFCEFLLYYNIFRPLQKFMQRAKHSKKILKDDKTTSKTKTIAKDAAKALTSILYFLIHSSKLSY